MSSVCQVSFNWVKGIKCVSSVCQLSQVCVNFSSVSSMDPVCFKCVLSVKCVSSVSRECQVCAKRVSCVSSV